MEVDELLEKPFWIVDILPEQVAKIQLVNILPLNNTI